LKKNTQRFIFEYTSTSKTLEKKNDTMRGEEINKKEGRSEQRKENRGPKQKEEQRESFEITPQTSQEMPIPLQSFESSDDSLIDV